MQFFAQSRVLRLVALGFLFVGVANAQTPILEELEEEAVANQLEAQSVARLAIPFVSGFAFHGLDPESPSSNGILVLHAGKVGLAAGEMQVGGGDYAFSGTNLAADNPTWFSLPSNRLLMLGTMKWLALSAVIGWPFVAFVLRGTMYTDDRLDATSGSLFFKFVGWVVNLLVLAVMIALYLLAVRRPEFWPGGPSVELAHVLPLIGGLAGTLALGVLGSMVGWIKGYWRFPGRFHYSLTMISALAFLWYLNQTGVLQQLLEQNIG